MHYFATICFASYALRYFTRQALFCYVMHYLYAKCILLFYKTTRSVFKLEKKPEMLAVSIEVRSTYFINVFSDFPVLLILINYVIFTRK